MTVRMTEGQKVKKARRPGPIGFDLGSKMMMRMRGPVPRSSPAMPSLRASGLKNRLSVVAPVESCISRGSVPRACGCNGSRLSGLHRSGW